VSQYTSALTVTNTESATISAVSIVQYDESYGVETVYEFTYPTATDYGAGSAYVVTLPSTIYVNDTDEDGLYTFEECNIIYNSDTTPMACTYDVDLLTISIEESTESLAAVAKGDSVTI